MSFVETYLINLKNMPPAIDITGEKYGRLTALSLAAPDEKGNRQWNFRCECGNETIRKPGSVRGGKTRSCGCLRKETTAKSRFRDFTGEVVGRLTVLRLADDRHSHNRIAWECRCSCGNLTTRNSHGLGKKIPTLSCGCLQKELASERGRNRKQENPVSRTKVYISEVKRVRRLRPEVVISERVSRMLALALSGVGAVKNGKTFDLLGFSAKELREHIEKQFLPGMSWGNRKMWEVDHITPISTATTADEVFALNQLSNLRPLWAKENNAKKDKRLFLI